MGNIFQISQELLDIFQEIEDNGGELTEELEAQLAVSQADFKTKVENYTKVIKQALSDIDLIDNEITRLKDLKESKKKAAERLKKIVIWAIEMFGDNTKSGGKFVDFGTGKVSVRTTESVEVNEPLVDGMIEDVFYYLEQLSYTKEIDEGADKDDILKLFKGNYPSLSITEDELNSLRTNINFNVNIRDLIDGEGVEFTKQLLKFIKVYKAKGNIDKTSLKVNLKEGDKDLHNIAKLVSNKNIQIK